MNKLTSRRPNRKYAESNINSKESKGPDKEIMTCDEVAEFLRVHVSSIRRWSRSGKLTAFKVGGRGDWRYREKDVLAFLYNTSRKGVGQEEVVSMPDE